MSPLRLPFPDDWVLRMAPQELAGRRAGTAFGGLCIVALGLIFVGDVVANPRGQLGVVALVPVSAAVWLLSQRMATVIVVLAMVMTATGTIATTGVLALAVINVLTIAVMAMLGRLAATGVLRGRDMAQREREARDDLARAHRLEHEKSEFLRLASHELRGPVSILRGYIAMLEDGSLGELPELARAVVPILDATAAGMNGTVDQMLDTARLDDDRLQLQRSPQDLGQLVVEAARTVAVLHAARDRIRFFGTERPLTVEVDAPRVRTMVGNLVSNAFKYSPAGAEVTVAMEMGGGRARVRVTDRGIGISEASMPRLFTRFGRIQDPRSEGVSGTGLGLYLSRELARRHGGDITVVSTPGRGSSFTLELPLTAPPSDLRPPAAAGDTTGPRTGRPAHPRARPMLSD